MIIDLLIAGFIGGLTGIVIHVLRNDKVLIFPKKRKRPKGIYLGFIADFLYGFFVAVLITAVQDNTLADVDTFVSSAIMAGISAEAYLIQKALSTEKAKTSGLNKMNNRLK